MPLAGRNDGAGPRLRGLARPAPAPAARPVSRRCVLREGEVGPGPVVVLDVPGEDVSQVALAQDEDMVETLSVDGVSVAKEIGRGGVVGEGVHDLLSGPRRGAEW
jgi:hypothetical protein